MPEVSVIIPNYNHAVFLKQRVDSVLNQTYQDFEVIILDDCSTDNSKDVIEQYRSHTRISQVIYNEQNSGSTFKQWIKGISLAQGNYVWIAESDDWCEPTFLENILPAMLLKPDCVVGYCQAYCVVGNEIKAQTSHLYLSEYIDGLSFIKKYMITTNSIYNASMAVWKKDALKNISLDFVNYRFCGDWLFWIELCTTGKVFISGRLLNYFRKHSMDVSGNAYSTGLNFIEELKLLKVINQKKLIGERVYKKEIARKFFNYKMKENIISAEMKNVIMQWFLKDVSINYLHKNYIELILKYKGYRFVKALIKKYK